MTMYFFSLTRPAKRNIFDDLPSVSAPVTSRLKDELELYLECPVENVKNTFEWWVKNCTVYLRLSRMALDYLSIPGTSSDFSQ